MSAPTYRYRITGIRWAEPEKGRQIALFGEEGHPQTEAGARHHLEDIKGSGQWQKYWHDLRLERQPVPTEWEPID